MMNILKTHRAHEGQVKFLEHNSYSTQTPMRLSIFEPENKPRGVLIWLSGLTCNEENFITKANALSCLNGHDLIVVCPDTSPRGLSLPLEHEDWDFGSGASFYVNATTEFYRDHYRMQDYIAIELYDLLEKQYGLAHCTSLMGHSMGGHGALTIGLTYPEKFRSISAFAPIVAPMQCAWGQKAFHGYLGSDQSTWKKYDSCELLSMGHTHPKPIFISQGSNDDFLETQLLTEKIQLAAKAAKQQLTLQSCEGYDHSYYFISTFIQDHIHFHLQYLAR